LSYVLDGENGLSICHRLYQGNVADREESPEALHRIRALLERNQIAPDTATLVLNYWCWTRARLHWRTRWSSKRLGWDGSQRFPGTRLLESCAPRQQRTELSSQEPGVSAAAQAMLVQGKEYLCVTKYSAPFADEQLHSYGSQQN
jgi:hypothetical protein